MFLARQAILVPRQGRNFAIPSSPPPAGGGTTAGPVQSSSGITAGMWAEINAQAALWGDNNNVKARIDALPTTGTVLSVDQNIAAAFAGGATTVILQGGNWNWSLQGRVYIPRNKFLIGAAGQLVSVNGAGVDYPIILQDGSTAQNLECNNCNGDAFLYYDQSGDRGPVSAFLFQARGYRPGYNNASGSNSAGIRITQSAQNCVACTVEGLQAWNQLGGTGPGSNADGLDSTYGALNTTFIDFYGFNNGDDGQDFWEGGQSWNYFGLIHDNGVIPGKVNSGDGNGIKLGTGNVAHKFYKVFSNNNQYGGYNLNGNFQNPVLILSTATGNVIGNYIGFTP